MPPEVDRPSWPTVDEVRRVVQPPEILGRPVEHWTASAYLRRVSVHVTRVLLRLGMSPNHVTVLMIATGLVTGPALLVPGLAGPVLAVVVGQLQMLWDCCDGEVARWTGRQSALGVFLDKVGHYGAELSIAVCLGVRAAGEPTPWGGEAFGAWAVALGAGLGALVVLNRAVNDMVHASRAAAGLPRLDVARWPELLVPRLGALARLRRLARVISVHRAFHSVELTLLVAVAATLDAVVGGGAAVALLVVLCGAAFVTVVGHVVAVATSGRLEA